jgi:hypothetical protein
LAPTHQHESWDSLCCFQSSQSAERNNHHNVIKYHGIWPWTVLVEYAESQKKLAADENNIGILIPSRTRILNGITENDEWLPKSSQVDLLYYWSRNMKSSMQKQAGNEANMTVVSIT